MGTILATQSWITPADYVVERSAVWGVLLIWWEMCAISIGQDTWLREVPFGGYRVRVGTDSSFWDNRSSAWKHSEIITDLYATVPTNLTPINMGTVQRQLVFYPSLGQYVLSIQIVPNGSVGMWYRFPPALDNAGSKLYPAAIPDSFYTVPVPAGVLFPTPFC